MANITSASPNTYYTAMNPTVVVCSVKKDFYEQKHLPSEPWGCKSRSKCRMDDTTTLYGRIRYGHHDADKDGTNDHTASKKGPQVAVASRPTSTLPGTSS